MNEKFENKLYMIGAKINIIETLSRVLLECIRNGEYGNVDIEHLAIILQNRIKDLDYRYKSLNL